MRAVQKTGSWGTRRIFRGTRCAEQAFLVRKGYSVPETASYGTGVHLHSEALGTGNALLWYGVHLQSAVQERASTFLAFVVFGAGNALLFLAV